MPKIKWLEIRGFRAFGGSAQRLEFSSALAVISGANSQGKTSLAEAFEFLITGHTVRTELMGGARTEFSHCLRNAHLPAGDEVYVKAGIVDGAGQLHEVTRRLKADYTATASCESVLEIDSNSVSDLESLGIFQSEPPLRAPTLMQHTLRWLLSAGPQSRADYFKAVLELQDLETVRREIVAIAQSPLLNPPLDEWFDRIQKAEAVPGFAATSKQLRLPATKYKHVAQLIEAGLAAILTTAGVSVVASDFDGKRKQFADLLDERKRALFPLLALDSAAAPALPTTGDELPALGTFATIVAGVDRDTSRLRALLEKALDVPAIAASTVPIDCPLCLTPLSLTPERVDAIRQLVATEARLDESSEAALGELDALRTSLLSAKRDWRRTLPPALDWSTQENETYLRSASDLAPSSHFLISDWQSELGTHKDAVRLLEASIDSAVQLVERTSQLVRAQEPPSINELQAILRQVATHSVAASTSRQRHAERASSLKDVLRPQIEQRSFADGSEQVKQLCDDPQAVAEALVAQKARTSVRILTEAAIAEVESANVKILDSRFAAMSGEIVKWWEKLRPDEVVAFSGVKRRASGRRFFDFSAALYPTADRTAKVSVERHAVSVFSDSQLNCLGMAAFLARTSQQSAPVVLMDDPVPASDEEHQATFSRYVVEELIKQGTQTIITTHDERLDRQLEAFYQHLPLDRFAIVNDDPEKGAVVVKKSDELEAMIATAQPFVRNHNDEIRKHGAARLRDCAERLCKEIAIKGRRAKGEIAALTDYDGNTLSELSPKVQPYLTGDLGDPGKMRVIATLLNPGSHDAPVPAANALVVALGDIKKFKKDYL